MMVLSGRISGLIAATVLSVMAAGAPAALAQTPADATAPVVPVAPVAPAEAAPAEAAAAAATGPVQRLPDETVEQFLLRLNTTAPGSVAGQIGNVINSSRTGLLDLVAFTRNAAAQTLKDGIRQGLETTIDADAEAMAKTIDGIVINNGQINQAALGELIAFSRTETGEPLAEFLGDALALMAANYPALAPAIRAEVANSELASLKESFADSAVQTAAGPGAGGAGGGAGAGGGGAIGGAGAGAAGNGPTTGGLSFGDGGTVQLAGGGAPTGGGSFSVGTTTTTSVSPSSP